MQLRENLPAEYRVLLDKQSYDFLISGAEGREKSREMGINDA